MTTYIISLTLLAAAVILLRAVFRKNVSSKLIYTMWLAVVVRLCLPFDLILLDIPVPELFTGNNAVAGYEQSTDVTEKEPVFVSPSTEVIGNTVTGGFSETVNGAVSGNVTVGGYVTPVIPDTPSQVGTLPQIEPPVVEPPAVETPIVDAPSQIETPVVETPDIHTEIGLSVKQIIGAVWFAGSAVTLCAFAISWLVFNVRLRKSRRYFGKTGRTKVYVSDKISSPCVCGVIPAIYITPDAEKSEYLSVILLHEKTHMAHGDHLWNIVRVAAVVLHWWNPVIWLSAVLSKRDAEFACDESVAKQLDSHEKLEYARMIVDMAPVKKNYAVSFSGGSIKERVLKLTREHKNKIIVAAVAIILVAGCLVVAFIGDKDDVPAETTEETTETTDEVTETTVDELPEPGPMYGAFSVLEATEENIAKYDTVKEYDVSTGEYSFSLLLAPTEDISDLAITRLTWNEELLLDGEEVIEKIGEVKAGEAVLLTTDPVETVGYVGISYIADGETVRYYPATSGKDGSAILVEIGKEMLSAHMLYHGLPQFEVTVSEEVSLSKLIEDLPKDIDLKTGFYYTEQKVLTVYGLSVPVYIEFGEYYKPISVTAYGRTAYLDDTWGEGDSTLRNTLREYDGAIFFSYNHYDMYVNTAVFTREEVKVFDSESGVSTIFEIDGDTLGYERVSVKFKRPVTQTATAPLELSVSRDEFFSETGKAHFENGKLVLEKPSESFTVGEAYDLDALFEEYKLNYLGYESADEVLERNRRREEGEEEPFAEQLIMPNESHIGNWNDGLDGIDIREVTADTVKFSSGKYRLFGFDGTATLKDGKWVFIEDNSSNTDEEKIRGRLEFTESSVTVIYDSDGRYGYLKGVVEDVFTRHTVTTENGRVYFGRIIPCRGLDYSNPYLGFYKLTFVPVDESYSVIESIEVCNGGCELSDKTPIAEYGTEDGWPYPVKVYATDFDESVKDIYPSQYIESKRTAKYVFDIGNGMHFEFTVTRYDSENSNNLLENEQELLDNIAKSCYLEYTLLDGKTDEEYPTVCKYAEVSSEHLAKAETDIRYKWIASFIGKDIDGCAEVLGTDGDSSRVNYYKEIMAPLKKLEFGSYRVEDLADDDPASSDRLLFEFTVIKSDYDVYPVGHYQAEISKNLLFEFYVNFIEKPESASLSQLDEAVLSKAKDDLVPVEALFNTAYNVNYPEDPYGDEKGWLAMSEHLVHTYVDAKNGKYYHTYGDGSAATITAVAERIYAKLKGDYKLHENSYFLTSNGDYGVVGHGGTVMTKDIVGYSDNITAVVNGSAEIFYVDVRYYSDIAEFGEAFTVRYTFDRVASVYGLVLYGIEKINDNGYTACGFTS